MDGKCEMGGCIHKLSPEARARRLKDGRNLAPSEQECVSTLEALVSGMLRAVQSSSRHTVRRKNDKARKEDAARDKELLEKRAARVKMMLRKGEFSCVAVLQYVLVFQRR